MAGKISLLLIASLIPAIHSKCKTTDTNFCTGVEQGIEWNGDSFNTKGNETMDDVEKKANEAGTSCTIIVENYSKWGLTNVAYTWRSGNGLHPSYPQRNVNPTTKEVMLATVWL